MNLKFEYICVFQKAVDEEIEMHGLRETDEQNGNRSGALRKRNATAQSVSHPSNLLYPNSKSQDHNIEDEAE